MAEEIVYRSRVRVERVKSSLRRAYLPAEKEPILFGTHSEIAQYYGRDPNALDPDIVHATTFDYIVAATAG